MALDIVGGGYLVRLSYTKIIYNQYDRLVNEYRLLLEVCCRGKAEYLEENLS